MISLHIKVDGLSPAQLDRALLYLVRTKQRSVQIAAGSEIQKGMDFVDRVRAALPNIIIFWRNLDPEDTGIHAKYSPQWVFNRKVQPYLAWFKRNAVVFVPDNESSGNDDQIRAYAVWMVSFLIIMHTAGLASAVCRFATGNIQESQYALLKPIFSAMLPMDWISPNEYSNAPGKSSGGHLARYKLMWKAAGRNLPTSIGEAGLCPDYDPGKGFRSIGMSGKAYAAQMIAEDVWYEDGQIDRYLFIVGKGWDSFSLIQEIGNGRVEADVLDELEKHYAAHPAPPVVEVPPTPTPTPLPNPPPDPADDDTGDMPPVVGGFTRAHLERMAVLYQKLSESEQLELEAAQVRADAYNELRQLCELAAKNAA